MQQREHNGEENRRPVRLPRRSQSHLLRPRDTSGTPGRPEIRAWAARNLHGIFHRIRSHHGKVVISGPPPVQVLDVTGPLEVFSSVPDYQVEVVSSDGSDQLMTNRRIKLAGTVPRDWVSGPIDTLVVAGGPGAESGEYDSAYVHWIADAARRSRRVASICTGVFLIAAAGLLDGKRAVTHCNFCDRLAREFPKVNVLPNPIFLRDGSIYTSAGITAGIDLCSRFWKRITDIRPR